ncbi:MAG: D-alanyl-D-alanine carboxypeptidase/D-alanyl-D-alanine-endopeptidase [Bacteroidaceae bacterium]|nr:D-alanyl-D-alanine carboxypeptidase/D-alanyl-D-alanine-endopeptidase [Bacteroidaceae bacterium]
MRRIVLYLFILCCVQVHANDVVPDDTTTWTGRMQRQLDSLTALPLFETTQVGLYVRDLTSQRDVYRLNHRQRMRPASNQKVVTAIAALHHLGGNYPICTRLLVSGEIKDSVLWGEVCVVGGMDPLLSQGEVYQMANALREAGIDSISGILRLDLSMKSPEDWGWGWCWDDDMTPLRPLMVDKRDRFVHEFLDNLQSVGIRGMSIERVVMADCPEDAQTIYEAKHTVDQVLPRMMKKSDNFFAESLFYQLAAFSGKRQAGRKEAGAYVDVLIRKVGLNPANYQIADGSGVSLYNYVSPELLVRLLEFAWNNNSIRQSLYPSLPIAGVDGTLEKRMRKTAAEGNIHAKTGTVDGVSSLSGYATSPEGHILVFSIINMGIPRAAVGRDWQDKVCEVLCKK